MHVTAGAAGITGESAEPGRARFIALACALGLLGFALREVYLFGAVVPSPGGGDSIDYWNYAWNLVNHGVFSAQPASAAVPVPDSWRSPGYPVLLALCQWLGGEHALAWTLQLQVLLGSLLVPASIALGRQWLSRNLSLFAGLLVATWPHLVVFSTLVLSEVPFALALVLALLALARAEASDSARLALLAGLLAGAAALVNPVFLLFPPVAAGVLFLRRGRRLAGGYLLAYLLLVGGWALRNASLPPGASAASRASENLVIGSWPEYHAAWNNRATEPLAAEYLRQADAEIGRMKADPAAGLADMLARMRSEPGAYLRWYLLEKPFLLWDWSVRIGVGDIYVAQTYRSPFERVPLLHALKRAAKSCTPLIFVLAAVGALLAVLRAARGSGRGRTDFAWLQVALVSIYLTAVHVVLQAEPRYSVAYRPLEMLLALSALAFVAERLRAAEPGR